MKVILIGGAQATGKTKIASKLAKKLNISHLMSTDQIKEIIKSIISKDQLPSIYANVLHVTNHSSNISSDKIWGYLRQTMDLKPCIEAVINTAYKYKDAVILEGIHLIPGIFNLDRSIKIYHFILQVPNETQHSKLVEEHLKTTVKIEDFNKIRNFQGYLVATAKTNEAIVLNSEDIDTCYNEILRHLGRKVIVFDLLGVVFPNKAGGSRYNINRLYDMLPNKPANFENFYEKYKLYMTGEISRQDFWHTAAINYENIEQKYLDTYEFNYDLIEFIQNNSDEYRFIALTNQPTEWVDYLKSKFDLDKYFEKIYVSGEMKFKKPQKTVYKLLLRDSNVDSSDMLIIDDQKKNLKVASSLGCKTIHVDNHTDFDEYKPDLTVQTIHELSSKLTEIF